MNILAFTSKFPIFFVVIILTILLLHNMRRADKIRKKTYDDFLERESKANSTRKKALDSVDYIVIPYEELPFTLEADDEVISRCLLRMEEFRTEPTANFTGVSNTDLKLMYGAPNISHLTRCDNNFIILARTLQEWAARLYELGHPKEALTILEFAIKIHSDISAGFYLAARIYAENGDYKKITWLKRQAEALNSLMSAPIIKTLNEKYPDA